MPVETMLANAVMEGKGAYNRNATIPARGAPIAFPFLEEAIEKMPLETESRPIVIADYGSSEGKNSLAPMGIAVRRAHARVGSGRPIFVYHVDQPSNDFNSLFAVLNGDPESYARAEANVYPCAIGRSFYEQVLPSGSVDLAWSSYAAVWLSRAPCLMPGHFFPVCSTGEVRSAFERQGAEDWKRFLRLRSREMRAGARLIVALPGANRDSGFAEMMNRANDALAEMVEEGAITAEERARMVLRSYPRRMEELLAPFDNNQRFEGLVLERRQEAPVADAAWADYQVDGDAESLAAKQALFFRAVFVPSLASALEPSRDGKAEAFLAFAGGLQSRLARRLAEMPVALDTTVQMVVVRRGAE